MKRKLSLALVLALAALLIGAVALAASGGLGMLDFMRGYAGNYVPENAQDYISTDVATLVQEQFSAQVRELYYDGRNANMVLDVKPQAEDVLLMGEGTAMDDLWQELVYAPGTTMDETDTRTIQSVYDERGYQRAYRVNAWLEDTDTVSTSQWAVLGEDGTLTDFLQVQLQSEAPVREAIVHVRLTPQGGGETIDLEQPITLQGEEGEAYVNTAPAEYESIGVRVDRLLVEVKPLEIGYTIDYTVTDREKYAVLEDGLGFEFVDPQSTAAEPYEQRLSDGVSMGGGTEMLDGSGTRLRRRGTLGRNELRDTYLLRAYSVWEKTRYESCELTMQPATEKEK